VHPFADIFAFAYTKRRYEDVEQPAVGGDWRARMFTVDAGLPEGQQALTFDDLTFGLPNPHFTQPAEGGLYMRDEEIKTPDVLVIKLGIEGYNNNNQKITTPVHIPPRITCEELLKAQVEASHAYKEQYQVVGVVFHRGEHITSGHYFCSMRRSMHRAESYFLIDDNVVFKMRDDDFARILNGEHPYDAQPFLIIYEKVSIREAKRQPLAVSNEQASEVVGQVAQQQ
jgi:hypothetical protein